MNTANSEIDFTSPSGTAMMHTAVIISRLKAAEPAVMKVCQCRAAKVKLSTTS